MNNHTITTTTAPIYDWLREKLDTRGLAPVTKQTAKELTPVEINKKRTRYGVLPIWTEQTRAKDFLTWQIPSNEIFPFRYFLRERIYNAKGDTLMYEVFAETPDQIGDIQLLRPDFIELPELFDLDESAAERIAQAIHLPIRCTKYPHQLGVSCSTCWLRYLEKDAVEKIEDLEGEEKTAAYAVARKIITGLESALDKCRKQVDEALRDVDDLRNPKSKLTDYDLQNIYNLHGDRPEYRTAVSKDDRLLSALEKMFGDKKETPVEIPSSVDDLREQMFALQRQIEAAEKAERQTASIEVVELTEEELEQRTRDRQISSLTKARASKKANKEDEPVE